VKTIGVLTSGGDAPGMNAALRVLAKVCASRGVRLLGAELGYDGLIDGRFQDLASGGSIAGDLDFAGNEGGTILGSARSTRFRTPEGRAKAAARFPSKLEGLVAIGGDGSLTGAHVLCAEHGVPVVGIPASIDNDVGCTELSVGVDTALNTIVEACDKIGDTARAHRRAFVVEVMGRESGYLAMAAAVACGADAVLFREQGRGEAEMVARVVETIRSAFARGKQRVLVLKSEGVRMPCTKLVRQVNEELEGSPVRATVLGHLVRGGRPSYQDRRVASRLALQAFEALQGGKTDVMTAWKTKGEATSDPSVSLHPIEAVLEESRALLDGSSPIIAWRLKMLEKVEGILGV